MDPEGSLPHSQQPATCPYPAPDRSSPCFHPTSVKSILIWSFHLGLGLPSAFLPSGLPSKTATYSNRGQTFTDLRATCRSVIIYFQYLLPWCVFTIDTDSVLCQLSSEAKERVLKLRQAVFAACKKWGRSHWSTWSVESERFFRPNISV